MGSDVARRAVGLVRRAVRWAWVRDEVQATSTREKVLYFVVLYAVWFGLLVAAGLGLGLAGYGDAAAAVWFFGVWFSAFMAAVDIAWEGLRYVADRRDDRIDGPDRDGPTRELAPTVRVDRDTWIGFVVTVVALVVLVASIELARLLAAL